MLPARHLFKDDAHAEDGVAGTVARTVARIVAGIVVITAAEGGVRKKSDGNLAYSIIAT